MRAIITLFLLGAFLPVFGQNASIRGILQDPEGEAVMFSNIVLYHAADSALAKVETSDEIGQFKMTGIAAGEYFLVATHVGNADLRQGDISLKNDQDLDLGVLTFQPASIELAEATVTASRALVEVKPDRTVFNVEGTINSTGEDAISLLRKAPAVTVDNNDNISVLGRTGVLIYVDGKRLPLTGDDLSNYLQSLPADQIDRIDIITNPGAKYEAEGNAGIIDIRLKKDKNLGSNGSLNATASQGQYARMNVGGSGNFRNKAMNVFASGGFADGESFNDMSFLTYQNGLFLDEEINNRNSWQNYNYRLGADFFLDEQHTIGFLAGGRHNVGERSTFDRMVIAQQATPNQIDSILIAQPTGESQRDQHTFNLNYRYQNGQGRSLNVDLDYGRYRNDTERQLPNRYYDANEEVLLTEIINRFDTPTDIDIYTMKLDFEENLFGGTLGLGTKLSKVVSDNTFLMYDELGEESILNDRSSNLFNYDENVYAGYISYQRPINDKWNFSAGLRAEQTDSRGDLQAFLPELQEDPVELNYLNWFPSLGLTWQVAPQHSLALNYGRRINRPDYNVLNPFENQLSQLSFEKGNPRLRPEIVNNVELGYTLAYRYNFKLGYSRTIDQITRLIAPDGEDPRAGFITWENLASQTVISGNISAPLQIASWWNAYTNLSASHIDNQADYGEGAVVDLQAFTYNIYQQHTFELPFDFRGEISGYFSGPGIWGGVLEYESNWSLNLGLQRKFFDDAMNVRLSANDLFYQTGWDGTSFFDGLQSTASGRWDSRRVSVSVSYNFGNQHVKSRRRKTGLEDEAGRLGD